MGPECSLPHSQVPATCPYPEPDRCSPYPQILVPEDPYYYPPFYVWVAAFSQVSQPKAGIDLSPPPYPLHAPPPEAKCVAIQVSSPCYRCPWYVSNRQIHEDLGVPMFADHIRALTTSFDSNLSDVWNPLVRQLGRYEYLRVLRVDSIAWRVSQGRQEPADHSRPSPTMAKSTKRISFGAGQPSACPLPWLRIFRDPPPGAAASLKRLTKITFATEPVWAQNPDNQPPKVYPVHN